MAVPPPQPPRRIARRIVAIVVGFVWFTVALFGYFAKDFFLYQVFRSLGFAFWVIYTLLGVGLVATIAWSALAPTAPAAPQQRPQDRDAEPARALIGTNPALPPSHPDTCFRCGRILPPWRQAEGTCTVCSPYSTFLRKPKVASQAVERRRTTLFMLEGLGIALLALAFVSAAYMFPLVLGPARPLLATLAFLVFVPLLAGLILWMYARHERHAAE
ncbi:MAG TPA: hypothetical protein VM241_03815 [Candidatus Thermoplasmatota archaeon]|nr:hypothetical protein [Candidatus Thermoplasmatota archaeon]